MTELGTGSPVAPWTESELRGRILDLAEEYARRFRPHRAFTAEKPRVPVAGRVLGPEEMRQLVDSALDFWLTSGRFNESFEQKLAEMLNVRSALTVNSGSSANLLACAALTASRLGKRALRAGDEVITTAVGFPTTVSPILQQGLVPVFVDVDVPTYNARTDAIEEAIGERTRAIILAHTLGNPFDLDSVLRIAREHELWLVEDCCDALGSTYKGKQVGSFGDIGTLSFYPAHHITTGEGGAVFTNSSKLHRILESLRGWGRDCWCAPGCDDSCGRRFSWNPGSLPRGYDHKYVYTESGYNLKMTDMQAAVGLAQLDRLAAFVATRRRNFSRLRQGLESLGDQLVLPRATPGSDPAWFGLPLSVREGAAFRRDEIVRWLEQKGIATRHLFGGNLVRQPFMQGRNFRVVGTLEQSDRVMNSTFWIGVYPGLGDSEIDYQIECLHEFIRERTL